MKKKFFFVLVIFFYLVSVKAQSKALVFRSDADSTFWLRATGAVQVWTRYTDHNPGTALNFGSQTTYRPVPSFDIGIRRARFQIFGNLGSRAFIYAQFGINNFSANSQRKAGAFFHDLTAEFALIPGYLSAGGGLTGWSGLSRYAAPSIASTLMYDAPLFQQTTNDVSDQFLRKLSLYTKGKIAALDYRVALSNPMPIQRASGIDTVLGTTAFQAQFSPSVPKLQLQSYIMWQFLEKENNQLPYLTGSYLGKKNVFNLGAGFIYQPEAMRYQDQAGNISFTPMRLAAIDLFYDHAINSETGTAITAYLGLFNFDFGPNHIRTLGVMNPANTSINPGVNKYSGFGNAFPMFGTGNLVYFQSGYKLKNNLLRNAGTLQLYADAMYARYHALETPVVVWNCGINWLLSDHHAKISLNYQERPVYMQNPVTLRGEQLISARRAMVVLQFQVFF